MVLKNLLEKEHEILSYILCNNVVKLVPTQISNQHSISYRIVSTGNNENINVILTIKSYLRYFKNIEMSLTNFIHNNQVS